MNNENQNFKQEIEKIANERDWGQEIVYKLILDNRGGCPIQSHYLKDYFWDKCETDELDPLKLVKIREIKMNIKFIKYFKKLDEKDYSTNNFKTRLSAHVMFEQEPTRNDLKIYEYIRLYFSNENQDKLLFSGLDFFTFDIQDHTTEINPEYFYKVGSVILKKIAPKLKECFRSFLIDFAKKEKIEATSLSI